MTSRLSPSPASRDPLEAAFWACQVEEPEALRRALDDLRQRPGFEPALLFPLWEEALGIKGEPLARMLIELGAPFTPPPSLPEAPSALMSAVSSGSALACELLIAAGANPNEPTLARPEAPFIQQSLLANAMLSSRPDLLRLLLSLGADPEGPPDLDIGPLHLAALTQNAEAIAILLSAGANPERLTLDGNTPRHYAVAGALSHPGSPVDASRPRQIIQTLDAALEARALRSSIPAAPASKSPLSL